MASPRRRLLCALLVREDRTVAASTELLRRSDPVFRVSIQSANQPRDIDGLLANVAFHDCTAGNAAAALHDPMSGCESAGPGSPDSSVDTAIVP